jgi:probable blue pigment (indigoidine) exporter
VAWCWQRWPSPSRAPPPALTGRNVAGFAYLGLVGTALAFVLWFNGIRRLPAAAPPLLVLAAPITGAALGWAVLGQSLSALQLSGLVVTLTAIAYGATLGATRTSQSIPDAEARRAPRVTRRAHRRSAVAMYEAS